MSEKMDGVRAYWNGVSLLSRHGKIIRSPEWFVSKLPSDVALDGELWMGQSTTHEDVLKVLNSKDSDWSKMGYYIFDITSSVETYEDRMDKMESLKALLPAHVRIVQNIKCRGTEQSNEYLDSIVTNKGEGAMLRKPLTIREMGYTSSLIKVKVVNRFPLTYC